MAAESSVFVATGPGMDAVRLEPKAKLPPLLYKQDKVYNDNHISLVVNLCVKVVKTSTKKYK